MENAYALPTGTVLAKFAVDPAKGLTKTQVAELRKEHGSNGEFQIVYEPS